MKVFFRRIHLYLGLASGLVIMIACFTGAVLVFEKEMLTSFNKDRYYVTPAGTRLTVDELVQQVKQQLPNNKVNNVKLYSDATRSAEVSVSLPNNNKEANNKTKAAGKKSNIDKPKGKKPEAKEGRSPSLTVFVNPYNGKVLEVYNYRETFFYTMFALHRWLLGSNDGIGKYIVGVSTLFFVIILITGIILWWPKTNRILKQRLLVKNNGGWKRLNHDLHIVLGFYSSIFLFAFAFTALAWSFQWFNDGIYKITNSPLKAPPPPLSEYVANTNTTSLENALSKARTIVPQAQFYTVALPKDSAQAINITALSVDAAHETASDAVYIDQYTGQLAGTMLYKERSLGAKVRSTFRPVHTGSIWGLPSKIIALITCLLGVTFPVTGVIMWLNRTRKKKSADKRLKAKQPTAVA